MKPILKWAGGKTQLLSVLLNMVPKEFGRYYEPFFGGGALFFELKPDKATINDFNFKLMNVYRVIRDNPFELMELLKKHENSHSEEHFLEIRSLFNQKINLNEYSIEDASNFIYLNKMSFNGLYRVNTNGYFNVPSAKKRICKLYEKSNILEATDLLENVSILSGDFIRGCCHARKGDFVFFDSPYYDTFDGYQKDRFSDHDHKRVYQMFSKLSKRGVKCLLTNSDSRFIRDLYKDFNITVVDVKRYISCNGKTRTGRELIVKNY